MVHNFFTVPKSNGRVRPILNLSDASETSFSINEQIKDRNEEICTVEYIQQCEVVELIHAFGIGAYLWAQDLKWGYNNLSIHKRDVKCLAFKFDGKYWCYQVLPIGATSGPFFFTEFMEFLKYDIKSANPDIFYLQLDKSQIKTEVFRKQADITIITDTVILALIDNYLDDIFSGHPIKEIAFQQAEFVQIKLKELGLAAQEDKRKGPAQSIDLLGKNYNTVTQMVTLTDAKFHKYSQ